MQKQVLGTISLYADTGWKRWFSKIRFWDAPYLKVEQLIPEKGIITELGCGEGIFSNFMALCSLKRKITGFDLDKSRIKEANRGLVNARFIYGDATKVKIPESDCIVMFHLLHHLLSRKDQEMVIKNCIGALKRKGKIVIVEVNNKPFIKYIISWLTDHVLIAWLFENRIYEPNIFFRTENEWIRVFKNNNLKHRVYHASKGKPFSHIIIVLEK